MSIVIVDDDPLHCELMAHWVSALGFTPLCFGSGEELLAWAATAGHPVLALLLDVDMPGRDGIDSCRALRSIATFANTPALFVTAHDTTQLLPRVATLERATLIAKDSQMLQQLFAWLAKLQPSTS